MALLERLKHVYRQGIRRKGRDPAHDDVQKEAALSALRNAMVIRDCCLIRNVCNGQQLATGRLYYVKRRRRDFVFFGGGSLLRIVHTRE